MQNSKMEENFRIVLTMEKEKSKFNVSTYIKANIRFVKMYQ